MVLSACDDNEAQGNLDKRKVKFIYEQFLNFWETASPLDSEAVFVWRTKGQEIARSFYTRACLTNRSAHLAAPSRALQSICV